MKTRTASIWIPVIVFTLLSSLQISSAYYDPSAQRWLSRDPIGEVDGPNLFAFVRNRVITFIDINGKTGWGPPFFPPPTEDLEACGSRIGQEVSEKGKPKDDKTSSYLHCVVSCRVSRECGPAGKLAVWIAGNKGDPISQDNRNKEGPEDRHANQVGRDLSCKRPKSCEELCGDAYRNGDLKYYPPPPTIPPLPPMGF